jgi:5-methyltetrahydrofolate--homocysteine methyltransferase
MATYLGSEPVFSPRTVWYTECIHDWSNYPAFAYDSENIWWKKHTEALKKAVELAGGDFLADIPDIIENVDIIASMRGPQNLLYDMKDEPEIIKSRVEQIDNLYFEYYDKIYDLVKDSAGGCSYTSFRIWGPGKTAKVQCDFSAMISPDDFREFVQPSLQKQCSRLDYSLYHLDGPDAIRHLDALMEIPELTALQWTPGAGNPDDAKWGVYDKVSKAGKCIWAAIGGIDFNSWLEMGDEYVRRYGPEKLYLLFPQMSEEQALILMKKAETDWK